MQYKITIGNTTPEYQVTERNYSRYEKAKFSNVVADFSAYPGSYLFSLPIVTGTTHVILPDLAEPVDST